MAVDFQCQQCGQLLSIDAEPGQTVNCPHCQKKAVVPEVLAALPRPLVPSNQARPEAPPGGGGEEPYVEKEQPEAVIAVMARAMPWVISVFFHLGLGLIFMFVAMIVKPPARVLSVTIPDAVLSEDPGQVNPTRSDRPDSSPQRFRRVQASETHERDIPEDTGQTDKQVTLIGRGAGGTIGGPGDFGLSTSGGGGRSNFAGTGGNAYHIVYLIDRSGSMIDSFLAVRLEIASSVAQLRPVQDFHVILFAGGQRLLEKQPPGLTAATDRNKLMLADFLKPVRAEASTNPIPAIKRAFEVLAGADMSRPGKLIYLLTDGVFPDNKKVLEIIRRRNKNKEVLINTFLYGNRPPEAERVMRKIAAENGGRYRYISPDE